MSESDKLHDILQVVSVYTGVSVEVMKSKERKGEVTTARHLFCYIAKKHVDCFEEENIANAVNRTRSNVYNSVTKIANRVDTNIDFADRVEKLVLLFNGQVSSVTRKANIITRKQRNMVDSIEYLTAENTSLENQLRDAQQLIKDQMLEIEAYRKQNEILMSKQN